MREENEGNSGNAFLLAWTEQAAAQGITVTVSSGDSGPATCDTRVPAARFGFAVNGIASTPWTIAVGGTDFSTLPANFSQYVNTSSAGSAPYYRTAKSYIPEVQWNDSTTLNTSISANAPYKNSSGGTNMAAAGGGASSCVTEDSSNNCLGGTQASLPASLTPNDGVRDLPDVSLFSSNGFDQAVWTVCADNVAKRCEFYLYRLPDHEWAAHQWFNVQRIWRHVDIRPGLCRDVGVGFAGTGRRAAWPGRFCSLSVGQVEAEHDISRHAVRRQFRGLRQRLA